MIRLNLADPGNQEAVRKFNWRFWLGQGKPY